MARLVSGRKGAGERPAGQARALGQGARPWTAQILASAPHKLQAIALTGGRGRARRPQRGPCPGHRAATGAKAGDRRTYADQYPV